MKNLRSLSSEQKPQLKVIDLFCGVGGFRIACQNALNELNYEMKCVFSSDIDKECQKVYYENFLEFPHGDIKNINEHDIPDHDILLAGFPCQPFSIIGERKGFEDIRGTLFFEIARILKAKKTRVFVLENVKQLVGHDSGKTLKRIINVLDELGYKTEYKVLNALDYGLPQKRERVFIIGFIGDKTFSWPAKSTVRKSLSQILEPNPDSKHEVSGYIFNKMKHLHTSDSDIKIWHQNKAGHISIYPYSCALRAGASYNYLLVNGKRRLTPREMFRLQGYPDTFKIISNDCQSRKQAGNSLPIPMAEAVIKHLVILSWGDNNKKYTPSYSQTLESISEENTQRVIL